LGCKSNYFYMKNDKAVVVEPFYAVVGTLLMSVATLIYFLYR
jgi:hypothetical protein